MSKPEIRILLVDDHAIVREGYRSLLKKQTGLSVVAEAADGIAAYQVFKETDPDITIMDLSLPGQSGLEVIARIRKYRVRAKILVFSMHLNPGYALQANRAGAMGYVTKSSAPEELIEAIYNVQKGQYSLSTDIARALAIEKLGAKVNVLEQLTVREFEILRMLAEAMSTGDIATKLNISVKTVSNCHYLIKRKLGVSTDIELTRLAIQTNVVSLLGMG
ncbi:MAG: response regulator transcription factor [Granulosicoccus sp.]